MLAKKTFKIALSVVLAIILAGMVIVSIFGFNKSVDYSNSYEIVVGVDQNVGSSSEIVKITADKFFADKNIKPVSTQKINDGAKYVYKFNAPTGVVESQLKEAIQTAINGEESIKNLVATVSISEVVQESGSNFNILLVIGIVLVAAFLYLLFTEKLANSLVAIVNSVISTIIFISIVGLSRIPISSMFDVLLISTFALTFVVTLGLTERFKEIMTLSGENKPNYSNVILSGIKLSIVRLVFVLSAVTFVSILLAVINCSFIFLALQLFIAGVSALAAAILFTCVLWPIFVKIKKSK